MELTSLNIYHNILATASGDDAVCIWGLVSGKCFHVLHRKKRPLLFILEPELIAVEVDQNTTLSSESWLKEPSIVMWGFNASDFTIWRLSLSGELGSNSPNGHGVSE